MSTQPLLDRGRAAVAALLALLLLVAGVVIAPPAHAAGPAVSATAVPRAGGTITVTGSGFSTAISPQHGKAVGVYLGVGPVGLPGFYVGSGQMTDVVWIAPGNADGALGDQRTAPMADDGSFSVQVNVPAFADGTQHALYTSKAHGGGFSDPSQNTTTALAWEPLPAVATTTTLTVSPAGSAEAGADFTLGATVDPAASGTVSYFHGDAKLGEAAVGESVTASIATAGTAQLKAVFAPADSAAFTGSTSAVVSYQITAKPVVEPEPEVGVPAITVSKTTGLSPDGETVTVTGTGFSPDAPATSGTRPPLAGTFAGSYVVFGKFLDDWKPSVGAPTSARPGLDTKWAVHEADLAKIGGAAAGGIVIAADGTFQTTLTVSKTEASSLLAGNYGIYTYSASGAKYAPFETYTPIDFAAPAPMPTVTVTKTAGLDPRGESITVSGTGFVESAPATTGTRPPLAGRFAGAYVVFGSFLDAWRPSEGAPTSARKQLDTKWGVHAAQLASIGGAAQGAVEIRPDGSFETTLTAAEAETALADGNYGVYTYSGSGAKYAAFETFTPISFAEVPAAASLSVTVTDASASAGAKLRVVGSDLGAATGAYAAVIEKGTESSVTSGGGYAAFALPFPTITAGATDFTVTAPTAKLDATKQYEAIVWVQHSLPTADTIYARADVPFTAADWAKLFPSTQPPVDPGTPPVTPTDPLAPQGAGSLKWAISSGFVNYVTGPIAHGSVAVGNGATRSGGQFQFGQAAGSTFDGATGTVSYTGAVRFTGHAGLLDVTVANPQVRVTSSSSASLFVTNGASQVNLATLNLAGGTRTVADGAVTYTAVPASLTAAGLSQVFAGNSTTLDPVTFTVGVASSAPAGSTGTVAAAPASARTTLPSTPPATTGIQLDDATLAALQAGEPVTVTAEGFEANESGIQVVVYSTPTLLGEVTADASGAATWTGSLPATLADGEHTLTFQGSVDRGIRFTLARAQTAATGCVVEGASLSWGFKESFRTYVEGIAAGGWELTDVVYEYPDFVWTGGIGTADASTRTGLVTFGGGIRFTGHGGALDTTLTNARVELAGDSGYLVFDVAGTTQAGEPVTAAGVRFAEFALPDLEVTDGGLVLDALPATLTPAGAEVFGTYAAGEALDPVSAVLPIEADCGVEPVTADDDAPVAEAVETSAISDEVAQGAPVWPWAVGGLVLALLIGATVWIVVSRRRATAGGSGGPTAS